MFLHCKNFLKINHGLFKSSVQFNGMLLHSFWASLKSSDNYWPEPDSVRVPLEYLRANAPSLSLSPPYLYCECRGGVGVAPQRVILPKYYWMLSRKGTTICQSAKYILELYIHIQIKINQLLIFTEKFLPLPGFEPRTSPVPSRYATNWAILAWMDLVLRIVHSKKNIFEPDIWKLILQCTKEVILKFIIGPHWNSLVKQNFSQKSRKMLIIQPTCLEEK